MDIYEFLDKHTIEYEKHEHEAVFTCGDAEKELRADLKGAHTKNIFMRDKKGRRHFLVVVGYDKSIDIQKLREELDTSKLSFASEERLMTHLKLTPGSVTILGLVHDTEHNVEVIIDQAVWDAENVLCHPLINTATLVIPHSGIEKLLEITGHTYQVLDVPAL